MISKGLNFERVSLVGIINPDASLSIPDFRSSERTYELLSQTSGRVGRFNLPGKVIIQTYNPSNYVYNAVIENDYDSFFNYEMNIRKKLSYPPYYYICNILVTSSDFNICGEGAKKIKNYLDNNLSKEYIILGPSVSSIVRLKNKYRFNIMIKYKNPDSLYKVLREIDNISISNVSVDISMNI
jgi:primosomal protein N' (replication factor Y)